jgi:anti-anti-sigma factor
MPRGHDQVRPAIGAGKAPRCRYWSAPQIPITQTMQSGRSFDISERGQDGLHLVLFTGELDLQAVPELRSTFRRLCIDGARTIELDLRGVTFIDPSGLRALRRALKLCDQHACELALVTNQAFPLGLLDDAQVRSRLPWRRLDPTADLER